MQLQFLQLRKENKCDNKSVSPNPTPSRIAETLYNSSSVDFVIERFEMACLLNS